MTEAIISINVPYDGGTIYSYYTDILHLSNNSFIYAFGQTNPHLSHIGHVKIDGLDTSTPSITFHKLFSTNSPVDPNSHVKSYRLSPSRFVYVSSYTSGGLRLYYTVFDVDTAGDLTVFAESLGSPYNVPADWPRTSAFVPRNPNSFYWIFVTTSGSLAFYEVSFTSGSFNFLSRHSLSSFSLPSPYFLIHETDENGNIYLYPRTSTGIISSIVKFDVSTNSVSTISVPANTLRAIYIMNSNNFLGLGAIPTTTYYHYTSGTWSAQSFMNTTTQTYHEFFRIDNEIVGYTTSSGENDYNQYIKLARFKNGTLTVLDATKNNDGLYFPETPPSGYTYYLNRHGEGNKAIKLYNNNSLIYFIKRLKSNEISWIMKTIRGE